MSADGRLRLVSSTARPDPVDVVAAPAVHVVPECLGRPWAASPACRAVWVLAGPPDVVGRRVGEALEAYVRATQPRPRAVIELITEGSHQ